MLSPQRRFFLYTAGKGRSRFTCFYKSWIRLNAPPRIPLRVKIRGTTKYADVVELVDSVDLGSSVFDVQVRVLSSAPYRVFITDLNVVNTRFFFSVMLQSKKPPLCKGRWQKSLIFDGGIVKWTINIINLSFPMQGTFVKI